MKWAKNISIIITLAGLVYGIVDYTRTKNDNKRLRANVTNLTNEKNDVATILEFTDRELSDFLEARFSELEAKIDSANIRKKNIERVIVQNHYYRDTTQRRTNLTPVVEAVQKGVKISQPFKDVSKCLAISGFIEYDGHRLELNITDRQFSSINEVVSHWKRKKWKLFGLIPTRLFGKREIKVTVFNDCGESKTVILTKKK